MAEAPPGTVKPAPDWERIEADYTAGILSIREIARADGNVTDTAIRKRAARDRWERNLEAKIHAKADALVRKAEVRTQVRAGAAANERLIVEANAEYIAKVRGAHRTDISKARDTLAVLSDQLAGMVDDALLGNIRALAAFEPEDPEADYGPELAANNAALVEAVGKLAQFQTRVAGAKALVEALGHAIRLEREALGLDKSADGSGSRPRVIIRDFTGKGDPDAPPQPE